MELESSIILRSKMAPSSKKYVAAMRLLAGKRGVHCAGTSEDMEFRPLGIPIPYRPTVGLSLVREAGNGFDDDLRVGQTPPRVAF